MDCTFLWFGECGLVSELVCYVCLQRIFLVCCDVIECCVLSDFPDLSFLLVFRGMISYDDDHVIIQNQCEQYNSLREDDQKIVVFFIRGWTFSRICPPWLPDLLKVFVEGKIIRSK